MSSRGSILRHSGHCRHAETPLICCFDTTLQSLTESWVPVEVILKRFTFPAMYGGKGNVDESQVCLQCVWVGNVLLSSLHFSASSQKTAPADSFMSSMTEEGVAALTRRRVLVLQQETQRAKFTLGSGRRKWRGAFVA